MSDIKKEEKKVWVPLPGKSGLWEPKRKGDELIGVYLKKESAPFQGRPNFKYCLESDHPNNVEGKISFYGTTALNSQLEDELIGKKLKITYKGESKAPNPPKKPFKKFKTEVLLSPSDPLYKKYMEGDSGVEDKPEPFFGDEEAYKWIDLFTKDIMADNKEPSTELILEYAKKFHIEDKKTLPASMLPKIEKELNRKG